MHCPKCGAKLERTYETGLEFCPQTVKIERFGNPYNRKCKVTKTGCGALFFVPIDDWTMVNKILPERYKAWEQGWQKN